LLPKRKDATTDKIATGPYW
jgi:hypothetical protein